MPRVPFEGLDWVGELPARESIAQPGGGRLELDSGEVATPARQQEALAVAVGVHSGGGIVTRPVVARGWQLTAEAAMEAQRWSKVEVEGARTHRGRPWPFYRRWPACFGIKGGNRVVVRRPR
jgi:antitoxin component of MazEF toxin-antitoxin module